MPWALLEYLLAFLLQVQEDRRSRRKRSRRPPRLLAAAAAAACASATAQLPARCPRPQSALLGCCMYQLIQLSDLESDFINPHDATRNINWVVVRLRLPVCWVGCTRLCWLAAGLPQRPSKTQQRCTRRRGCSRMRRLTQPSLSCTALAHASCPSMAARRR